MEKNVRCDVDDLVFPASDGKFPNNGHAECPGPACRKKFEAEQTPAQKAAIAAKRAELAQAAAETAAAIADTHRQEADRLQQLAAAESNTEAAIAAAGSPVAASAGLTPLQQVLASK